MALKKKHVDHLNGVGEIVQQDKKQADQYQQQNVGIFIAHLKKQKNIVASKQRWGNDKKRQTKKAQRVPRSLRRPPHKKNALGWK